MGDIVGIMSLTSFLVIAHIVGVVFGAGAATMSDLLFMRSIRRNEIQEAEFRVFHFLSKFVWIGLLLLIISGLGFLLYYRIEVPESGLIYKPKLLVKLVVTAVIFFNGLIMHAALMPKLAKMVGKPLDRSDFPKMARYFFMFGAVSVISWYTALILGAWRGLTASFSAIFMVYAIVVVIAMAGVFLFTPFFLKIVMKRHK